MTVSSTTAKDTYSGDGADTTFDFTFSILDETHIKVQIKDANGTFTTQTLTTHYTVSGTGNTSGNTDYTTGTVTFVTAPAATEEIVLSRNIPIKQTTDYAENDTFPAETHETALDKLTMICQQISERASRSITFPDDSSVTDITLPEPTDNEDKYLKYNSAGTAIEVVTLNTTAGLGAVSDDAAPVLGGNLTVGAYTATVTTALTLIEDTATVGAALSLREGTDNGTNFLAFKAPDAITTSVTFELPDGDGTAGQILKTDGSGNLDWTNNAVGLNDVVDDTTPQLGGDLDVNGNDIVSTSNGAINITPDGTGNVAVTTNNFTLTGGSGQQSKLSMFEDTANGSEYVRLQPPSSLAASYTLTFPADDGDSGEVLSTNGAGTLSWTAAGLTNVVEDTTPQLGGDLDANGSDIQFDDATGIRDDGDNEQLIFQKTSSATNYFEMTNASTGTDVILGAAGSDANVGIEIQPKGTGDVTILGTATDSGTILLREDTDNGTNEIGFKAPAALTTSTTFTLPDGDGAADNILKTNGSGVLSWTTNASGLSNVVDDTTPQLGGDLDMNGNQITSPDGTDLLDIPDGSIDLQTASTSRLDITDSGVRLGAANARVTTILDEDAMGSDSATALATQQSIKAYVDSATSGDWVKISSTTISDDATVDFTGLSSTYEAYKFLVTDMKPATDGAYMFFRTSTDGGSSYDSGASDYFWGYETQKFHSTTSDGQAGDEADSEITFFGILGSDTDETLNAEFLLFNPAGTAYTYVQFLGIGFANDGGIYRTWGGGLRASAADVDAVRFLADSGNISSGTITVYGLVA